MRLATNFTFANPFYADEVRVYPIRFYGDKVFRIELYGCYLGEILFILIIIMVIIINVTINDHIKGSAKTDSLCHRLFLVTMSFVQLFWKPLKASR